ncbi:MAG: hypothetical protein DRH37_08650 [Deltaproteobacteria bacterium]|nr:MAG: hypothetical protein DRH37_08650 [Deltaproteobacteria bacterium]
MTLTIEELRAGVPKHSRKMITQNVVEVLNQLSSDHGEDFAEHYKQNLMSMSTVLKSGTYNMKDYMNAVKFSAFRLMDHSDVDSYMLAFPERYQRLMLKYADYGDEQSIRADKISSFVTAYKKNEIVAKVTEQALIPSRILNAPMFQTALNIQMSIAMSSRSDQVRSQAAESVMKYTMSPEVQKIELEVGVKGQDEIMALRTEMHRLASQQQGTIMSGTNTSLEIAEQVILHEIEDHDDIDISGELG